jgi:hypothetical protein
MREAGILSLFAIAVLSGSSGGDDLLERGFSLMYEESLAWLSIGTDSEVVREYLPEPYIDEPMFWAATAELHQSWKYPDEGLLLDMVISTDCSDTLVSALFAFSPCTLETLRGIRIGSRIEDVEDAYGEHRDPVSNGEAFIAGTIYGGVIFSMEKGLVASIFIGAAAE